LSENRSFVHGSEFRDQRLEGSKRDQDQDIKTESRHVSRVETKT